MQSLTGPKAPSIEEVQEALVRRSSDLALHVRLHPADEFVDRDSRSATVWTSAILNALLEEGKARQFEVWPRVKCVFRDERGTYHKGSPGTSDADRGEWLVDASWTTYASVRAWVDVLPTRRLDSYAGIVLACESEWGVPGDPRRHEELVMEDFLKLVDLRAQLKVMFFGFSESEYGSSFDALCRLCEQAARHDDSQASYLLMAWPEGARLSEAKARLRSKVLAR